MNERCTSCATVWRYFCILGRDTYCLDWGLLCLRCLVLTAVALCLQFARTIFNVSSIISPLVSTVCQHFHEHYFYHVSAFNSILNVLLKENVSLYAIVAANIVMAERDVPVCIAPSSSVFVLHPSLHPTTHCWYISLHFQPPLPPSPLSSHLHSLPPAETINIMSRGWQCSFMEHCMFIRGRRSLREMLTVFINGPHPRLMRHGTS